MLVPAAHSHFNEGMTETRLSDGIGEKWERWWWVAIESY